MERKTAHDERAVSLSMRRRRWKRFKNFLLRAMVFLPILLLPVNASADEKIHAASFAGSFYPAQEQALQEAVEHYLAQAQNRPNPEETLKALVVPHAGYEYSGPVAAEAYKTLEGHSFKTVLLIGFSHRVPFPGIFIDRADFYETPLGRISVNLKLAGQLYDASPVLQNSPAGTFSEHSLEVQLPFLQTVLKDFQIVPVYMGEQNLQTVQILAEALSRLNLDDETLLVFSTDLSHYHPYAAAQKADLHLVELFQDADLFALAKNFDAGKIEACGIGPLLTLLLLGQKLGWSNPQLLRYANSGDTSGGRESVVGYAAFKVKKNAEFSALEKKRIVDYVRSFLQAYYEQSPQAPVLNLQNSWLDQPLGIFVTLRKNGELRGCVGRVISDGPVREVLPHVALAAALHDGRFLPVEAEELPQLEIEVSILTEPKPVSSYRDIRLGVDGIIVRSGDKSGLFLPEVALETGWDQETFFRQCAFEKAGLTKDEIEKAEVLTFQSIKLKSPSKLEDVKIGNP